MCIAEGRAEGVVVVFRDGSTATLQGRNSEDHAHLAER
jgi:hypothetical protein